MCDRNGIRKVATDVYLVGDQWIMDITGTIDSKDAVYSFAVPNINISSMVLDRAQYDPTCNTISTEGDKILLRQLGPVLYESKLLYGKPKTQEMTLEQIERELGHKVKIITK